MKKWLNNFWNNYIAEKSAAWTAIFTAVLTLTTILLAYIAYETNETNKVSQRAFIGFGGLGGNKITDVPGKTVVGVQLIAVWQNGGNTPTRTAYTRISWQTFLPDLPENFGFPDSGNPVDTRPFVVGPKSNTPIAIVVPINTFDDVKNARSRLFLWGWSTYHDAFRNSPIRLSEFCLEITNVTGNLTDPSPAPIQWQTVTCKVHNCSDEDCPDYKERAAWKPGPK